MPDPRLVRGLSALLPRRVVADAFEPAWEDLRVTYLIRRQHVTSPLGRAAQRTVYVSLTLLLFLDCWRLAIVDWIKREPSTPARRIPPSIAEPKQTEHLHMFLYLVRHALRQLVREPAFTVAALLTLALGVGANAAVFAVVEAVLLRPLPYPSADDLVILNYRDKQTGITKEFIAIGDFIDLSARQKAFESIGAWGRGETAFMDRDDPYRAEVLGVGANTIDLLRARPVLGRSINADDTRENAPRVMMLGY